MGSSIPDDSSSEEMLEPSAEEPSDKPFDEEPFDAGVEADEDENPEKYIQQLSGKLGQSLRSYTDDLAEPDYDLEKFAINSVLSATNSGEMDSEDQSDIIQKVKSSSTDTIDDESDDDNEPEVEDDDVDSEGGLDLDDIDMEEGDNKKTVFADSTLGVGNGGMEENKYSTNESKKGTDVFKDKIKNMLKENFIDEFEMMTTQPEPQTKPKTEPKTKPNRRSKPWRIIPEQLPDPQPKADATSVKFIDSSNFSSDGNSVTLTFDIKGKRFNGVNFTNSGQVVSKPSEEDEPYVYLYTTDILDNGKQYMINVSKYGEPDNHSNPSFTNGNKPEIKEF